MRSLQSRLARVGRSVYNNREVKRMKHIKTIQPACLKQSAAQGGCGQCQSSCQSACKTSCTVANQSCKQREK